MARPEPEQLSLLALLQQLARLVNGEEGNVPFHYTCFQLQSLQLSRNNVADFKRKIAKMRKIIDLMEKDCTSLINKKCLWKDEIQHYNDVEISEE